MEKCVSRNFETLLQLYPVQAVQSLESKVKSILAFAFDVVAVKQCLSPGNHLMTNFGTKTKIFPPPGDLPSEYVFNCP